MSQLKEKLNAIIAPIVTGLGYEYWGMEYHPQGRHSLLRVYIDSPAGVTVDDCGRVSEQLSAVLDVEDLVHGRYTLEVSSPGLERPLFTLTHYQRFIGKIVRIRTRVPLEGRRQFKGILQSVDNEMIIVESEGHTLTIPFNSIEKANLEWEVK